MRRTIGILFLTLIGLGLMDLTPAEVSHDEIRGTIQSLIYSYNQLDNKLERHEHRERALGELMKKAMQALQKGQKSLEPINGIFGRLDERVSQIETMLITQEEKYNVQTEKLGEALEHMFKWMRENDECFKRPPVSADSNPIVAATIPAEYVKEQAQINTQLLNEVKQLSENVAKLLESSQNEPSTADLLAKIDEKLVNYEPAVAVVEPVSNKEFETRVLEKFDALNTGLADIRTLTTENNGLKNYVQGLANETLNALKNTKIDVLSASDKVLAKTTSRLKETEDNMMVNINRVFETLTEAADQLERFHQETNGSYSKLNESLEVFGKFNNILMTNSEYVLDTQRKVEFGQLQIVQKIGDLLDQQRSYLHHRFENIEDSQMEAMQNLSTLIETEISHVWRQIVIMHDEITDSKDLLSLLQSRNEVYVNSTFSSMDTMGGKLEAIKSRMLDMDANLNFLLGKLSVMSQEFSNIKTGLAESLEELRQTFHTVQEKMPASPGPGPHNIAKHLYETELNLLHKRDVS